MLEVRGLAAGYGEVQVLHGLDLAVSASSITAVVGSNGAGKTTLMRCLAGLIPATAGSLRFKETEITAESAARRLARGLALVPEGRLVFPGFTVGETLKIGGFSARARSGWQTRAEEMLALFPRLAERRDSRAGSLSGGEQQMLALARGLMSRPRLLMLDEPSLGLAPIMARSLFDTIAKLRAGGLTLLLVEQDVAAALSLADHAYVLENGRIITQGSGRDLLASPAIRKSYLGI